MEWVKVEEERARTHPLYGIGGWLLLIVVLFGLNIVSNVISVLVFLFIGAPSPPPGMEMAGPQMGLFDVVLMLVGLAFGVYVLYLVFIRSELVVRQVPQLFVGVYALSVVLMLLGAMTGPAFFGDVVIGAVIGGAVTAIMYLYFTRSRRVHVTFAHELPKDEAAAAS